MDTSAQPPRPVLARYAPAFDGLRWVRAPGGFSGADVWRGEDDRGSPVFALKAWPPEVGPDRVARVHHWMALAAHLPFVPGLLNTHDGGTAVAHAGRVWDVTRWLPGAPRDEPTDAEVEAACAAVARLHAAWPPTGCGPCPGALNRLRVLAEWHASPAPPGPPLPPPLASLLRSADAVVSRHGTPAAALLRPWAAPQFPLRSCVRDLRGEHVLFTAGEVTGIVDYGAAAEDHPALDLARLLGDYAPDHDARFAAGLGAYRAAGGDPDVTAEFVRVLDYAGAVCSVIGWLVRLRVERRRFPDPAAVASRLERLVARLERHPA